MNQVSRSCKLASVSLLLLVAGCQVSPPGRLERAVARQVKQRITVGGKRDANPLPANPENIRAGQEAFSHYCIVCHGLDPSGMPASRGILNDEEMWAIVDYIRHLPPKGSLGEPAVYTGEERPPAHDREDRVRKSKNGHAKRPNQPGS